VIGFGGSAADFPASLRSEASPSSRRAGVLYVVSRFPTVSETFVVNEWRRLAKRLTIHFAALVESRERPIQPEAAALLPVVRFMPLLHARTIRANLSLLASRPGMYVGLLLRVLRGSAGRPMGGIVKGLVVFWKSVRLAQLVRENRVGHVHAHFINHPGTAAWIVSKLTGASFSITAHANDLFVGPALLEEKVRDAAFVVAISEYNREELRKVASNGTPLHVIRCGVDIGAFPYRKRDRLRRLLCVARLADTKGQADLIRAFSMLAGKFPDASLELVGAGPERSRLESLVRSLGLSERVHFRGALTSREVRECLAHADLFVLAALADGSGAKDGIPVALIEAMASGLPVVATRISGIPELVRDGETGLLVPPRSPDLLAGALRHLMENTELGQRLARGARAHVASEFALEREADRLGTLFERVLERSSAPAVGR
jgi:colanic acid/amylovoran biosynthesis glycosyltransferase